MRINQKVATPFGPGYIQGAMDGGILVRIKLSDLTNKTSIRQAVTKHPHLSALFVIAETEIKKG
jgi:hypothetical protein